MALFSFTGKVGETVSLIFDFGEDLARPRRPGYQYSLGQYVNIGAFTYECTSAGKTDPVDLEVWPTTIDETFNDGSVEWTCRDFSLLGSDTISSKSFESGAGVNVDSSTVEQSVRVHADITLSAKGRQSVVCEAVTVAGETLREEIIIVVSL